MASSVSWPCWSSSPRSRNDAAHGLRGGKADSEVSPEQVDQCRLAEEGAESGSALSVGAVGVEQKPSFRFELLPADGDGGGRPVQLIDQPKRQHGPDLPGTSTSLPVSQQQRMRDAQH